MGNWVNDCLVVRGDKEVVDSFIRVALTLPVLEQYDVLPEGAGSISGESSDLMIEGPDEWRGSWSEVQYHFQTKNYLPLVDFQKVSKDYPQLCFVLGYCDANDNTYGSYFIYKGKKEEFELQGERLATYLEDEDFQGWEPMDEVIQYWDEKVVSTLS